MKTTFPILALLFGLAFAGCEQIIDPNDPNFEPELFVYGLVGPGELPKVFFTETQPNIGWFEQIIEITYPKGLSPSILTPQGEQLLNEKEGFGTFYNYVIREIDTSYNVFYEGSMPLPDSGDYKLNLTYRGKEITAITKAPKYVGLDSVYSRTIKYEDSGGSWAQIVLVAEFTDHAGSKEGYRIQTGYRGYRSRPEFSPDGQFLGYDSTYVDESSFRGTESDQGIDGQKMEITFSPYINMIPETETLPDGSTRPYYPVWVVLETQSEELLIFQESAEEQSYNYGDPFVEPTFIKGNVQGGLGVFGAYQRSDTIWTKYYLY